jgi:hypothetical protein
MQLKGKAYNYPVRGYSDIAEIRSILLSYNFIVSAARHGKSVNYLVIIFFFLSLIRPSVLVPFRINFLNYESYRQFVRLLRRISRRAQQTQT